MPIVVKKIGENIINDHLVKFEFQLERKRDIL